MQYKDYELYTNNPTLNSDEQDYYDRDLTLPIGLISTLPPTAMFIINRAKAFDRKRNKMLAIRDKQMQIRRGFSNIKDQRAFAMAEEAQNSDKVREILREIDEIKALNSDPSADQDLIKLKVNTLMSKQSELAQEIFQDKYAIYASSDMKQAARTRDILLNTAEHDWARIAAGETNEESLERLTKTVVMMEQRNIVGKIHTQTKPTDITRAGQRFYDMMVKTLEKSTRSTQGDGFQVTIESSRAGLYDYKIKFNKQVGHITKGTVLTVSSHQLLNENRFINQPEAFDHGLVDAFESYDGTVRRFVNPISTKGGKNVVHLHSDRMFRAGGSGTNFIAFLGRAIRQQSTRFGGTYDLQAKLSAQNRQYIEATGMSVSVGKGNNSDIGLTQMFVQDERIQLDERAKARARTAGKDGRFKTAKSEYEYAQEFHERLLASGNNVVVEIDDPVHGKKQVEMKGLKLSAELSSASGVPKGTFQVIHTDEWVRGGSPFGQQAMRANSVTGTSLNFLFSKAQEIENNRKLQGTGKRRSATKYVPSIRDFNSARYDFISAKRLSKVQQQIETDDSFKRTASFRTEETVIMLGDNEANLKVSMDQTIKVLKYGNGSITDMIKDPNVSLSEIHESITELYEHNVVFNPSGNDGLPKLAYYSGSVDKAGELNYTSSNNMMGKIDEALKERRSYLIITKKEAELLGLKVGQNREYGAVPGKPGEKTYMVFFEESQKARGADPSIRHFKFFDAENSLIAHENNKINLKQTFTPMTTGQVADLARGSMDAGRAAVKEFERRVSSGAVNMVMGQALLEKNYSMHTVEGAFRKVLSEFVKNELDGITDLDSHLQYGLFGHTVINDGKESIFQYRPSKEQKSLYNTANRLFNKLVLNQEWKKGENYIRDIRISKDRQGRITKVDFSYNIKAMRKLDLAKMNMGLAEALKKGKYEELKAIEKSISGLFSTYKTGSSDGFLVSTGESVSSATGRYIESVVVGDKDLSKGFVPRYVHLISGFGTPEGHQIYSSVTPPRLGNYLFQSGPKLNIYDIQSIAGINKEMAKYYKALQSASYEMNTRDGVYAAQLNRKFNLTASKNAPPSTKVFKESLQRKVTNNGLKELRWKNAATIKNLDAEGNLIADQFHSVKTDARDILSVVRKAQEQGLKGDQLQRYIDSELGLDGDMILDTKEAIESLEQFDSKNQSIVNELTGSSYKVKGINLNENITLHTMSTGKGPVVSDFLLYQSLNPGDMPKYTVEDLAKNLDFLDDNHKRRWLEAKSRQLKASQSGINSMVMLDNYSASVIRLEAANENMRLLKEAQKSGNLTGEQSEHLLIAINSMKRVMERNANEIDKRLSSKAYGKDALEKVAPQFSANFRIEKSDLFSNAFDDIDWRTAVISLPQASEMAKSSFILGTRGREALMSPEIRQYINALNNQHVKKTQRSLDYKGTPYESIMDDMFSEIEERSNPLAEKPETVAEAARSRYKDLSKKLRTLKSYISGKPEAPKIDVDALKKYKSINQVRTLFSEEGFYNKIQTQMKSSNVSEGTMNIWKDINAILENNKINNNRKSVDSGRLWEGWKSLGERLSNKTQITELKTAVMNSFEKNDAKGRAKAQAIMSYLDSISTQYAEAKKSGSIGIPDYQKKFGETADLMMAMDSIGAGRKDVKNILKGRTGNYSQLSKRIESLDKKARQATSTFMDYELLIRQYDGMTSFSSEKEVLKLLHPKMNDKEIEAFAARRTQQLIKTAEKLMHRMEADDPNAGKEMAEKIGKFLDVLKTTDQKVGFTYELANAMKFIRNIGSVGVSAIGKVDPDILAGKHVQGMTLRLVLEHQIKGLKLSDYEKNSLLESIRNGKMKLGDVISHIMDRDFDGDSGNVYSALMDERWGISSNKLSSSNVASMMKNMSFSRVGNQFIPTNASAALMSEMLLNESKGAHTVVMETAYEAATRRLKREGAAVGKTEGFNFDASLREVIDDFVESNHTGKPLTEKEKLELMHKTYVIKNVEGGVVSSDKRFIKVGNSTYEIGKKEREMMGLDTYSKSMAKDFGMSDVSVDRTELNKLVDFAAKTRQEGEEFLERYKNVYTGQSDPSRITYEKFLKHELSETGRYATQKTATGRLYKYPTMMRLLSDAMTNGETGEVKKMGQLMGNLAEMASYTFQQKIAIGMKKGGIDAVEGVDSLFKDIFNIANIEDEKERSSAVKGLYEKVVKQGLTANIDGSEKKVLIDSGYFEFKGMKNPSAVKMQVNELLQFGVAKQKALEALIDGSKQDAFNSYLKETYKGHNSSVEKLSAGILSAVRGRANELVEKAGMDAKNVFHTMLNHQIESNSDLATANSAMIRFTELGLHLMTNLVAKSSATSELQDIKGLMKIIGSNNEISSDDVLVHEHFRNISNKAKSLGLNSTVVQRFLSYMNTATDTQGNAIMDLLYASNTGPNLKYMRGNGPKQQLLGKNFGVKAAGVGLGMLALGSLAPSPAVGKNSNSVVDKSDEYSAMLPDKMIAQYNNQASVVQINPWVTNRLKQERDESARFNQMFHKTFTG